MHKKPLSYTRFPSKTYNLEFIPKSMTIKHFLAASLLSYAMAVQAGSLDGTIFEQVGNEFEIDPLLLYSISLSESGYAPSRREEARQPWPWTIGSAKGPKFAANKEDAEMALENLKKRGFKNIDVGLMQVNIFWHKDKVKDVDLFDPLENLRAGAKILKHALDSAKGDLVTGIGRYHNWNDSWRQAKYALHVLSVYKRLSDTTADANKPILASNYNEDQQKAKGKSVQEAKVNQSVINSNTKKKPAGKDELGLKSSSQKLALG